jgi:hypothetical protein
LTNTPTPSITPTNILSPTETLTATLSPTSTPVILGITLGLPYPNPVPGAGPVNIDVSVPALTTLTWEVFTTAYRKVAGGSQSVIGNSTFSWNLADRGGSTVSNGLYYLRLTALAVGGKTVKIYKILVLR